MADALHAVRNNEVADISIREGAFAFIVDEAIRSRDGKETGGILIGVDEGTTTEIRCAGGPGPRAIRRPDLISRDTAFAQRIVDREWWRDGSDWVGEWHTHIFGRPVPSELDQRTYRSIIREPDLEFRRFFSLILRDDDGSWNDMDVAMWEVDRLGVRPRSWVLV